MKIDIDLERLRRLAMKMNSNHAAWGYARDEAELQRNIYRRAKGVLDKWISDNGDRIPHSDSSLFGTYEMLKSNVEVSIPLMKHTEAELARVAEIKAVSDALARRGLEFAQEHIVVPIDILELYV